MYSYFIFFLFSGMTVDLVRDMIIGTDFHRGVGVIGEVAGQVLETIGNMISSKLNTSTVDSR